MDILAKSNNVSVDESVTLNSINKISLTLLKTLESKIAALTGTILSSKANMFDIKNLFFIF